MSQAAHRRIVRSSKYSIFGDGSNQKNEMEGVYPLLAHVTFIHFKNLSFLTVYATEVK